MPIYAFTCDACGHAFDRLQKLADPDPEQCPSCGSAGQIRRQLTAPAFRLAGSGWYETDFKKQGDRKRNLAGEGGEGAKPAADGKASGADTAATPKKDAGSSASAAAPAPAQKPSSGGE